MDTNIFRVQPDQALDLSKHDTAFTGSFTNKKEAEKALKGNIKRLKKLQRVLYADDKRSLLIIFQAMDAAGKDGSIRHVMSGVNPQGTQVFSFKKPSAEELDHGYLWRCAKRVPERGRIGIFNRSYYEDVLVVRVHPGIIKGGKMPDELKNDPNIWDKRFTQIRDFERYLSENGTKVIKFFLNVSKEEQKNRFIARIDTPEKNWKFSDADLKERGFWDDYQFAYKEAIQATSTADSPWFVMPADNKWFTRLAVSEVVCETLEAMDLKYPQVDDEHLAMLAEARKQLMAE